MVVGIMSPPRLVETAELEPVPLSLPLPLMSQPTLLPLDVAANETLPSLDCCTFAPVKVEVEVTEVRLEVGIVVKTRRTHDLKERPIAVRH